MDSSSDGRASHYQSHPSWEQHRQNSSGPPTTHHSTLLSKLNCPCQLHMGDKSWSTQNPKLSLPVFPLCQVSTFQPKDRLAGLPQQTTNQKGKPGACLPSCKHPILMDEFQNFPPTFYSELSGEPFSSSAFPHRPVQIEMPGVSHLSDLLFLSLSSVGKTLPNVHDCPHKPGLFLRSSLGSRILSIYL